MRMKPRALDLRDERGATTVIVIVSLLALMGMLVLSVDLGGMLAKRRGMVNAADAAALAAAESYARNEAEALVNDGPAQTQADLLATDNISNAVRDDYIVQTGLGGEDCVPVSACGSVTVKYHGVTKLFFGPILGFGQTATIHSQATAIWGPAGGGNPTPIMIRYDWMTEECERPFPDPNPPVNCGFWLNDHDDNGNPMWSWLNLNPYPGSSAGWNVPIGFNCPNVGANDRSDWINGINVPDLPINQAPAPTFVCTTSGHASANFSDLVDQIGEYRVLPVNDANGIFAPPGQVDRDGNWCPPSTPCTPDKYDIVGFTELRIDDVLHGNDPVAIGTLGSMGDCLKNHGFNTNDVLDLDTINGSGCPNTSQTDILNPLPPSLLSKNGTPFVENVDYTYDAANHVVTWTGADTNGVDIKFHWEIYPTKGKCGTHASDPNAVCLVASWQGYQPGGFDPGGGIDFGVRAIRLSE
jgi:hypothetical protein